MPQESNKNSATTRSAEDIDREMKELLLEEQRLKVKLVKQQLSDYADKEAEIEQKKRVQIENIRKNDEELRRIRTMCAHKTGGTDKAGFYHGNAVHGYSVTLQITPVGERYYMCFRCQNEWHRPSKRAVLDGTLTLEEYYRQEAEYIEVSKWPRQYFGDQGEPCAASQFRVPALEAQQAKDNADFAAYLAVHKATA